ncbi:hypothetical protein AWE47_01840 [Piscirickettsia salmonis]|uniref:hypothetical protein n=1 Tax=Piscirickettsia salmonis TaxID=1238 RepID=UPI0007430903|nr:hypothetical protein [Piscirickettsia salmonis]ALY01762.1 hypothetical protein AWE47_01840 [Piscirickettsia salmonis]
MSGSAASTGTGAITAIETIKVSDGAIATFGGTIAGVTATGGIAVGVGATANFDAVISNSVTASSGNETIKYTRHRRRGEWWGGDGGRALLM